MDAVENLINELLTNPDNVSDDMLEGLSNEQLSEVLKGVDIYGKTYPGADDTKARGVAFSYSNPRALYHNFFAFTALQSFLYTVSKEHESDATVRRWNNDIIKDEAKAANLRIDYNMVRNGVDSAKILSNIAQQKSSADDLTESVLHEYLFLHKIVELGKIAGCLIDDYYGRASSSIDLMDDGAEKDTFKGMLANAPPPNTADNTVPIVVSRRIIKEFLDRYLRFDPTKHVKPASKSVKTKAANVDELRKIIRNDQCAMDYVPEPMAVGADDTNGGGPSGDNPPEDAPCSDDGITISEYNPDASRPFNIEWEHLDITEREFLVEDPKRVKALIAILSEPRMVDILNGALARVEADETTYQDLTEGIVLNTNSALATAPSIPYDSITRLERYIDDHYEEIRQFILTAYNVDPWSEFSYLPYDYFEGETAEDVNKQFRDFAADNHDKFFHVPHCAPMDGRWCILASVGQNKKNVFTKKDNFTMLVQERLDAERKLGDDMMKKRVMNDKAEDIRRNGPDAASFRAAANTLSSRTPESRGVDRVIKEDEMRLINQAQGDPELLQHLHFIADKRKEIKDIEDKATSEGRALLPEEVRNIEELNGEINASIEMSKVPKNAVQVDVLIVDGDDMKKSKIYTEAEAPEGGPSGS